MPKLPLTLPTPQPDFPNPGPFMNAVRQLYQQIAAVWNNPDFGPTAARPASQLTVGQQFFDTTLHYPVFWDGASWRNGAGTIV